MKISHFIPLYDDPESIAILNRSIDLIRDQSRMGHNIHVFIIEKGIRHKKDLKIASNLGKNVTFRYFSSDHFSNKNKNFKVFPKSLDIIIAGISDSILHFHGTAKFSRFVKKITDSVPNPAIWSFFGILNKDDFKNGNLFSFSSFPLNVNLFLVENPNELKIINQFTKNAIVVPSSFDYQNIDHIRQRDQYSIAVFGDTLSYDFNHLKKTIFNLRKSDSRWNAKIFIDPIEDSFFGEKLDHLQSSGISVVKDGDFLKEDRSLWFWGLDDSSRPNFYRGSVLRSCLMGMFPVVRVWPGVTELDHFVKTSGGCFVSDDEIEKDNFSDLFSEAMINASKKLDFCPVPSNEMDFEKHFGSFYSIVNLSDSVRSAYQIAARFSDQNFTRKKLR